MTSFTMYRVVQSMCMPEPSSGSKRSPTPSSRAVDYASSPPTIIATSATLYTQSHLLASKEIDGPLCQYRKTFFEHLKPRALVTSTLRVVMQQGTLIMANFMTDQLEQDMKRNELVDEGRLSRAEADEQAEEWERIEWGKRWQVYPSRLFSAFAKYHVIILVMRLYESVAANIYDKVILDKLTMDPFHAARKLMARQPKDRPTNNNEIARQMFRTTFWANMICFMADYSVHQVILCYGYYAYYVRERRKRQALRPGQEGGKDEDHMKEAIMSSFCKKSTQLMAARGLGLVFSATGGAVGSVVWPGWGTLLFANMGEGAAGVIVEDGQAPKKK